MKDAYKSLERVWTNLKNSSHCTFIFINICITITFDEDGGDFKLTVCPYLLWWKEQIKTAKIVSHLKIVIVLAYNKKALYIDE